jgi:hypothetical protein|tara:strand:+ start:57084 stop:57533 length:450 start_codon:yes stop_codon:yes gene_type:complete
MHNDGIDWKRTGLVAGAVAALIGVSQIDNLFDRDSRAGLVWHSSGDDFGLHVPHERADVRVEVDAVRDRMQNMDGRLANGSGAFEASSDAFELEMERLADQLEKLADEHEDARGAERAAIESQMRQLGGRMAQLTTEMAGNAISEALGQ